MKADMDLKLTQLKAIDTEVFLKYSQIFEDARGVYNNARGVYVKKSQHVDYLFTPSFFINTLTDFVVKIHIIFKLYVALPFYN